jgi:2-oxoglutarate dehydrogenase E2 component (dihydrolipoamide succinyltransferase)
MSIEVRVPALPESVADATVSGIHKNIGDAIARDENFIDLETDKVVLEIPATTDGSVTKITIEIGDQVKEGDLLAIISETADAPVETAEASSAVEPEPAASTDAAPAGPAARVLAEANELQITDITGSGKDGRILKEDVQAQASQSETTKPAPAKQPEAQDIPSQTGNRVEQRVPMTRLRQRIAERLVQAQHEAAMLTTFNEVDMTEVMNLRNVYKEKFEKSHSVRLGFMSFFVKATIEALKRYPSVNASIDGTDVIYHGYYDIGIAVSSPRGLVVPILRNVDQMSFAEIESTINEYAAKAKEGTLSLDDMTGGTFTITNGGVFGSLLSTPILNPPQSGILGMHKIMERPMVENGQVVAKPMMYLAHSYDHRIIDGREAVGFLVTIKEALEDPARLLLQI